jgi:hypothetical protein
MKRATLVALFVVCTLSVWMTAADQTITIDDPPRFLPPEASKLIHMEDATLPPENAKALIQLTLGAAGLDDPNFYCMIHILTWKDDQATVQADHWYVYHPGTWSRTDFSRLRIFGSGNVALLYVHLNARGETSSASLIEELSKNSPEDLATKLTNRDASKSPLSPEQFSKSVNDREIRSPGDLAGELAKDIMDDLKAGKPYATQDGQPVSPLGTGYVEKRYPGIAYKVEVTKKLPANIQSLNAVIGLFQGAQEKLPAPVQRVDLWGGRKMSIGYIPSDITAHALVKTDTTKDPTEVSSATYDDEGRYYWDVSVGVPVSKINQLQYSADTGTVSAKTIDKQNLFAFVNLFFKPVDLKDTKSGLIPRALIGVAINSQPLNRVFFGGGIGINKVQLFAGLVLNKVQSPATLKSGGAATPSQLNSDLQGRYDKKFLMGLNLPVRQVVDALKAKK